MEEPEGRSHPQTHIDQWGTYFAVDSSSYFVFKSKSSAWVVSSAAKDGERQLRVFLVQSELKKQIQTWAILLSENIIFDSFLLLNSYFARETLAFLFLTDDSWDFLRSPGLADTYSRCVRLTMSVKHNNHQQLGFFFPTHFHNGWTFIEK